MSNKGGDWLISGETSFILRIRFSCLNMMHGKCGAACRRACLYLIHGTVGRKLATEMDAARPAVVLFRWFKPAPYSESFSRNHALA